MARPEIRVGPYWDGRLEEWLSVLLTHDPDEDRPEHTQTWDFPTDALRAEYLATVADRDEHDVRVLLRWFLFDIATFGRDQENLEGLLRLEDSRREKVLRDSEYHRRLSREKEHAHPGVRWALDLLPGHPRAALDVVNAYFLAHEMSLPDARLHGLDDAAAVIHAFYISRGVATGREAIMTITPRDFEILIARLYRSMGYEVELTRPQKDGGRDVIAVRSEPGRRQRLLIDCKRYTVPVKLKAAREMLGIVTGEKATGGVIVTSGRVTRGVKNFARDNNRFDYVNGEALVPMLNEHLGANWHQRLGSLIRPFQEDGSAAG